MCRGVEAVSRPCVEPCVEPDVEDVEARAQVELTVRACRWTDLMARAALRAWNTRKKHAEGPPCTCIKASASETQMEVRYDRKRDARQVQVRSGAVTGSSV